LRLVGFSDLNFFKCPKNRPDFPGFIKAGPVIPFKNDRDGFWFPLNVNELRKRQKWRCLCTYTRRFLKNEGGDRDAGICDEREADMSGVLYVQRLQPDAAPGYRGGGSDSSVP